MNFRIYDCHVHSWNGATDPDRLLRKMEEAGVYGGIVFSNCPKEYSDSAGTSFGERMAELHRLTDGRTDRLFPFLWIHPYEENVLEKMNEAAREGVFGFKIICNDFYVYEEKPLAVMRRAAELGKPVLFHTGILWDGKVSSDYNRPQNWEALLPIKGLRFCLAHCSWPWIDDCIALYGKFLAARRSGQDTADMFLDVTPGTPEIYRKDLLSKLYGIYDVSRSVMFGTDSSADGYSPEYASELIATDGKILDELGVGEYLRAGLYGDSLMRFIGLKPESGILPKDDGYVEGIIRKYYGLLGFPGRYDAEFEKALREIRISDAISIDRYDWRGGDGRRDLLSVLYMCEELHKKYAEKGIGDGVFLDTLSDVLRWASEWTFVRGYLCLSELPWLKRIFDMRLFRIGRLQFCLDEADFDAPEKGLRRGQKIVAVHIPPGSPLMTDECLRSVSDAEDFINDYFPEHSGAPFTCRSWLLDPGLSGLLPKDSNILAFAGLFDLVGTEPSDCLLRFVFRADATRENLRLFPACSSFAAKVKKACLNGGAFASGTGILKR